MSVSTQTPPGRAVSGRKAAEPNSITGISPSAEVQINVQQGTIWAVPDGGAVRVRCDHVVRWCCNQAFTLTFREIGSGSTPVEARKSKRNADGKHCIDVLFRATTKPGPYYEYTVKSGDFTLDPIVIVDKPS